MTEKPLPALTQSALPVHSPISLDKPSKDAFPKAKPKKEEDSIQCICNYPDDDGNTIFCEECKTWQHIACYYPGRENEALEEEFRHSCADCEPRELDRHRAAERMQFRLGFLLVDGEPHDKKHKKPPSKTHKKKTKPNDLQLNGNAVGSDGTKHGSPLDHPPSKKAKTSHKSSQSISAQAHKRSPSHSVPKLSHHAHPLSPATTPPDLPIDFDFQSYHPNTVTHRQRSVQIVDNNTTANLKTRNLMSLWSKPDSGQFRQDTKLEFRDVVQMMSPTPFQPAPVVDAPEVTVAGGTLLMRPHLVLPAAVAKDVPLLELNGLIGLQKDYCEDIDNRYAELCAPLPFVFFPPYFPLYIDTRNEGSNARYASLSCHPNARLETYVSDDSDYHFWLVSDCVIAANEKITLPWDFRLPEPLQSYMERLLGRNDEENTGHAVTEIGLSEYKSLADWIWNLIAEYGGCACNGGDDCAFARFRIDFEEKFQPRPNAQKRKRAKSRPHTISPTSTGQATNSRAASEGHLEDVSEAELNIADGASRSKPPSRDRTPARLGSFDTPAILTEQTNRDKRKVQMAENLFQKSAQEQQQSTRKKKKTTTDGATSTSKPKARNMSQASGKAAGADERPNPSTIQPTSKISSPTTAVPQVATNEASGTATKRQSVASELRQSPSPTSRNYTTTAVQTDLESTSGSPRKTRPQRRVVSLAMKLMNQRRLDSLRAQQRAGGAMELESPATTKSQGSQSTAREQIRPSSPAVANVDIIMVDVPPLAAVSPAELSPSMSNGPEAPNSPTKPRSPDLHVQMPLTSTLASPVSTTLVTTTSSATPSVTIVTPLPPFSVIGGTSTCSPIKKKMSLSEYKNKAIKAAASARPPAEASHPLKTASSVEDTSASVLHSDPDTKELDS